MSHADPLARPAPGRLVPARLPVPFAVPLPVPAPHADAAGRRAP